MEVEVSDELPSYSGYIWPPSLLLSRYLTRKFPPSSGFWDEKCVLELGCGIAIPSITLMLAGCRQVVATDFIDEALDLVRYNSNNICQAFQLNSHSIHTKLLAWGDSRAVSSLAHQFRFDYLIGSFLLWQHDTFPLLARTIADLSQPQTVTILTADEPTREADFLRAVSECGLVYEKVTPEQDNLLQDLVKEVEPTSLLIIRKRDVEQL
eukprot:TRINITY_DN4283_c0_g1_i1.p1 TRINITY_DN4283_c0_g1~~TRINITY_DN4283_c0_g1_i1.p1  ORF type:complete len:209 (+),score=24.47 TRINITY_DN4283_c0_g1_i1:267-893(+)